MFLSGTTVQRRQVLSSRMFRAPSLFMSSAVLCKAIGRMDSLNCVIYFETNTLIRIFA
jgi:hypothetical protein